MKTGLHIQDWVTGAEDYVMAAKPPLIKVMVNDIEPLKRYKEEVGGFVAVRAHFSAIGLPGEPTFDRPEEQGDAWAEALLPWLEPIRPYTDLVILSNEAGQGNARGTDSIIGRHAVFDGVATLNLHREGYKVGGGAFSVGNPPGTGEGLRANWNQYGAALDYIDVLVLHEYGAPSMMVEADQTWRCLRFQRVIDILDSLEARKVPILIGECGIDWGVLGHPLTGWRGHGDYGISSTTPQDYIAQLQWYNQHLEAEPRILGATIFNVGYQDWQSFEVRGLAELKDWMAEASKVPTNIVIPPTIIPFRAPAEAPANSPADQHYRLGAGSRDWVASLPNLTGAPLEDEGYHHDDPMDPREISFTRTEQGTMTWFKKTGAQFYYHEDSDTLYRKSRHTGAFEKPTGWESLRPGGLEAGE